MLDAYVANPGDTSWEPISILGDVTLYDRTSIDQVVERSREADIIIVNKAKVREEHINSLPNLKLICVLATGMDNVDYEYARSKGIEVKNAVGYGSTAVAQHAFALLFELTNNVALHNSSVQNLEWTNNDDWCYWKEGITELHGKTLGIYGLGTIGKAVAKIGEAFGMQIAATSNHAKRADYPNWKLVDLEELFTISDVISLHAPLTSANEKIVNKQLLHKMKKTAFLINTGRGGLINENDLKQALQERQLAGAGLDVLSLEPPAEDHPLLGLDNCLITPHHAWAARESRVRLIGMVAENIREFLAKG
ncbi:MAG: D-2-hydroxyacid dehydrogenase [Cyclobacteriaceae bacterium]|nr:D-2-hydroxyacid dehydrogenase [Cyclobacteriaceae bacterium SS2]